MRILLTLLLLTALSGAQEHDYEAFFKRTEGWTGADGTYSTPLGERGTLWGFSDTFFGNVRNGTRVEPLRFVNNSLVLQKGAELTFFEAPVFRPPGREGWFWLCDSLARPSGQVEILLGQFRTNGLGGAFGFEQFGVWWARFQLPETGKRVKVLEYRRLPFFQQRNGELITFGSAITRVGPWCYIYGIHQKGFQRDAVVARAPGDSLGVEGTWQFYTGGGWSSDIWSCESLFPGASMEFSVHRTQSGAYVYISNAEGGMTDRIVARKAPSPAGPWSKPTPVKQLPKHHKNVFYYNGKAHPELSREGKILISYNVNTSDLKQVVEDADIYRPRFFWWTPPDESWLPTP